MNLKPVPTGYPGLDRQLGGGWPRNRLSIAYGQVGIGKSLLGLRSLAECVKGGLVPVHIDGDSTFDPKWAQEAGVDLAAVELCRPSSAEEAFGITLAASGCRDVGLVVIDPVWLSPSAELSSRVEDPTWLDCARLWANGVMSLKQQLLGNRIDGQPGPAILLLDGVRLSRDKAGEVICRPFTSATHFNQADVAVHLVGDSSFSIEKHFAVFSR